MKVLFAGPSLYGSTIDLGDIELRPPAAQGDLLRATFDGASVIGLVDGNFEAVASVWHKEILFALSKGVRVLGAASMGALRAAECAAFGMEAIGKVATAYCAGRLEDDAAVAQLHGPAELGYLPLTETLVDVAATLDRLLDNGAIAAAEHALLGKSAGSLFFKERTVDAIIDGSGLGDRTNPVRELYRRRHFSIKRQDAEALVRLMRECPDQRGTTTPDWQLSQSVFLRKLLQSHQPAIGV
jgi:hypothetical protein